MPVFTRFARFLNMSKSVILQHNHIHIQYSKCEVRNAKELASDPTFHYQIRSFGAKFRLKYKQEKKERGGNRKSKGKNFPLKTDEKITVANRA